MTGNKEINELEAIIENAGGRLVGSHGIFQCSEETLRALEENQTTVELDEKHKVIRLVKNDMYVCGVSYI